jgi:aldehyde dehydrogenase
VNAAHETFRAWSASSPMHRQFLLREIAGRILARHLDYTMMETLNNGKTITESFIDVAGAVVVFEYYAGAALTRSRMSVVERALLT